MVIVGTPRRRVWPWLVSGIVVVLVVLITGLVVDVALSTAGAPAPYRRAYALAPHSSGADARKRTEPPIGDLTVIPVELVTTTLVKGDDAPLRAGQGVVVNYVGWSYRTKQKFDSSWTRGEPFAFHLGVGEVIPGWDRALIGVTVGSRVQIDVPSAYAYGDYGPVPGPLRFVVDVLEAA